MTPLVSILLPTRKRRIMLESSLVSLLNRAQHPERIEICIAHDDDDKESQDYFSSLTWQKLLNTYQCTAQVYSVPRWGYGELHRYLNFLAERAHGEWMFFWGDDALMETQNWDQQIVHNQNFVGLLHIPASNAPMYCSILPLFHRKWVDLFGCVSPINHADSWITDIAKAARARRVIPVSIFHDRFEDSGHNNDETYNDKRNAIISGSNQDYHKPEYVKMRQDWAQKLATYRDSQSV